MLADRLPDRRLGRTAKATVVAAMLVGVVGVGVWVAQRVRTPSYDRIALPLRQAASLTLPGAGTRFDYADVDPSNHTLWLAHLGDSAVVEVDTKTRRVLRTVTNLGSVTGVIVVPALHRVYASTPGTGEVATLDENTGTVIARAPAGEYPDGLAYVPTTGQVWVSDESGGQDTVIDASSGHRVGTVGLGGEAGNTRYDSLHDRVLVAVQGLNQLLALDPRTRAVLQRASLPGCDHGHGLAVEGDRAFVACDGNDTLVTLSLSHLSPLGSLRVGHNPDVLAVDPVRHRLYVAAESGVVTTIDTSTPVGRVTGRDLLGGNAHVVAVDQSTGTAYFPLPSGAQGTPELLIAVPSD